MRIMPRILSALLLPASLFADVTGGPGVIVLSTPPPSVQWNQLESNTDIFAFKEVSNVMLPVPLLVDVTKPGTYATEADLTPGFISAGTVVNSYLVHSDPNEPLLPDVLVPYLNRLLTFNEQIVGLMFLDTTLQASNLFLAAPGTAYPPPQLDWGLKLNIDDGPIIWSGSNVTWNTHTGSGADGGGEDDIRVITVAAPVPEPGTLWLAAAALGLMLFWRQRSTLSKRA
jgi:hypothetical protein